MTTRDYDVKLMEKKKKTNRLIVLKLGRRLTNSEYSAINMSFFKERFLSFFFYSIRVFTLPKTKLQPLSKGWAPSYYGAFCSLHSCCILIDSHYQTSNSAFETVVAGKSYFVHEADSTRKAQGHYPYVNTPSPSFETCKSFEDSSSFKREYFQRKMNHGILILPSMLGYAS